MSKTAVDGIYRDGDSPRISESLWLLKFARMEYCIQVVESNKNYVKKKPVDVKWTGWLLQSRFDTRPAAGTLGSRAAEQGFVLQPGLTQRKKVFYRCKVAQNFMLYRCCCTIEFLMARLPFNWWQTTNFACVKEAAVAAACRRADGLPEQSYWLVAAATFGSGGLINKLLTLKNC